MGQGHHFHNGEEESEADVGGNGEKVKGEGRVGVKEGGEREGGWVMQKRLNRGCPSSGRELSSMFKHFPT